MSPVFFHGLQGGSEGNFRKGTIHIASYDGGLEIQIYFGFSVLNKINLFFSHILSLINSARFLLTNFM